MNRIIIALLLILAALPAAAQSKSESFSTRYNSDWDAYGYETTYEFEIPPHTNDRSIQNVLSSEIIVDLYWNTRRVWVIWATVECRSESGNRWTTYAETTSDHHFVSVRTAVFTDECRVRLAFLNHPGDAYKNSSQRASLRINVSSTTGGHLRLTKTHNPLGVTGAQGHASVSRTNQQVLRDRIEAREAALARQ